VIGFVLEKVEGRYPTADDLPACQAVLSKFHSSGFILDRSFMKYNFLITPSGNAIITDFSGTRIGLSSHAAEFASRMSRNGSLHLQLDTFWKRESPLWCYVFLQAITTHYQHEVFSRALCRMVG
jgi:hypothetical protein